MMLTRPKLFTAFACACLSSLSAAAAAQKPAQGNAEWPQWRGPNRNGISTEKLAEEGKAEPLWKTNVGMGYSTVSVKNGLLYTIGHDKEKQKDTVVCLKADTGEKVWSRTYKCKTMAKAHRGGSLSTPSVIGANVWVLNREGHLYCYDAKSGKVKWHKFLEKKYKAKRPTWGFAAAPYLVGDRVFVNVGRVLAFSPKGKLLWRTKKNYGAGYSTPVEVTFDQRACLLVLNGKGLVMLDQKNGKQIALHPFKTNHDVNAATPVVAGDKVFLSAGYGHGCAMVTMTKRGFKLDWESKVMRNHMAGCTFFDGHIYGFDMSQLKCLDLDGNVKWAQKGTGKAAHLIADGKLVVITSRGDLVLAKASPDGFEELSRTNVLKGGVYWTPPVVVGGLIYCRNSKGDLVCADHRG